MIIYRDHDHKTNQLSTKYALFLDDERIPSNVTWVKLPLVEWVVVRNYNEFCECITRYSIPSMIAFDHDLSDCAYQEYHRAKAENRPINYNNYKEKTGFHCAQWLANYCVDNNLPIPVYYTHTLNGDGALNIASILESAKRFMFNRTEEKKRNET